MIAKAVGENGNRSKAKAMARAVHLLGPPGKSRPAC
jgi:hypothetical protein